MKLKIIGKLIIFKYLINTFIIDDKKLGNTEIDDVNADSSSGNIQAQVFAICDDGGV